MPASSITPNVSSEKTRCNVCHSDYDKNYIKNHFKTKKHLKNMHNKRISRIKKEVVDQVPNADDDDDAETDIIDENS